MGWQDRDYNRNYDRPADFAQPLRRVLNRRWSMVGILLATNIAVFVLCTLGGGRFGPPASRLFEWTAMHTPAVLHGQVWRVVTATFLHWNLNHILMNMLGLFFLGRMLEQDWGRRRFLQVYLSAGILGFVFYMLLNLVGWLPMEGVAAGASGCVLGLLGVCAVRYPSAEVFVYFLVPVKIRTIALLFGAWYALNLFVVGPNAGGDACHLAGLVFGVWWAMKGDRWWSRVRPASTLKGFWSRPGGRQKFAARWEERRQDEETIDRILKKVGEFGIHSLTEAEKDTLRAATDRQRIRDSNAGRLDRI